MFELHPHVEIAQIWSQARSQLVCDLLASWKAKFHYAVQLARRSQTG